MKGVKEQQSANLQIHCQLLKAIETSEAEGVKTKGVKEQQSANLQIHCQLSTVKGNRERQRQ